MTKFKDKQKFSHSRQLCTTTSRHLNKWCLQQIWSMKEIWSLIFGDSSSNSPLNRNSNYSMYKVRQPYSNRHNGQGVDMTWKAALFILPFFVFASVFMAFSCRLASSFLSYLTRFLLFLILYLVKVSIKNYYKSNWLILTS